MDEREQTDDRDVRADPRRQQEAVTFHPAPITPGHFAGFQVLHWPAGAEGRGVLFSGDQPQVCADPNWVSFSWSYPKTRRSPQVTKSCPS